MYNKKLRTQSKYRNYNSNKIKLKKIHVLFNKCRKLLRYKFISGTCLKPALHVIFHSVKISYLLQLMFQTSNNTAAAFYELGWYLEQNSTWHKGTFRFFHPVRDVYRGTQKQ